jgi:hypothetical protein
VRPLNFTVREQLVQRLLQVFGVALALASCATQLETAIFQAPDGSAKWKAAGGSDRRGRTLAEFVPRDESIENWSRLLTVQFIEQRDVSPMELMTQLRATMQNRCAGTSWRIVQQDPTSVLYEWSIAGCGSNPDQHEIARLLRGNDGIQRIAFTRKGAELEPSEREQWIKTFSEAYVVKGGLRVVVAP